MEVAPTNLSERENREVEEQENKVVQKLKAAMEYSLKPLKNAYTKYRKLSPINAMIKSRWSIHQTCTS